MIIWLFARTPHYCIDGQLNRFCLGLKEPCESDMDDLVLILQQVICEHTLCQELLCRAAIVHWNSSINHPLMLEIIKTVDTYQIALVLHHDSNHYDIKLRNSLDCHCHCYLIIKMCLGLRHLLLGCISEPKLKGSSMHWSLLLLLILNCAFP